MNKVDAVKAPLAVRPAAVMHQGQRNTIWHVESPPVEGHRISAARRCLWLSLSLGCFFMAPKVLAMPLSASATAVAERDARAVRAVIEAQLQSFTAGNAESAFSHASGAIRTQFGDAATFMAMVLNSYPMLVQPAATSFFVPEWADGSVLQKVQLRDRAGRSWLATYQMLRQPDATWRINGCAVLPDSGKSST